MSIGSLEEKAYQDNIFHLKREIIQLKSKIKQRDEILKLCSLKLESLPFDSRHELQETIRTISQEGDNV
jgi:hypothetical protein